MAEREKLIELKDLQITFGSGKKKFVAVDHVNFDIYKGETFSLVGESGSGKTTIGRAICRINPTSGGDIFFKGQKINGKISKELDKEVISKIQMIFQDPQSSLNERATGSDFVGEGRQNVRPDLTAAQREENGRQALLDDGVLLGIRHELVVHLIIPERLGADGVLGFLSHRHPRVGEDAVGGGDRLPRIGGDQDGAAVLGGDPIRVGDEGGIGKIHERTGDADVQACGGTDQQR